VQAFKDAPIYARTNGYLRRWTADIGTRVKAGQLLAEIDTPEVDQQLHQARADLTTAEANVHLSEITANRLPRVAEERFRFATGWPTTLPATLLPRKRSSNPPRPTCGASRTSNLFQRNLRTLRWSHHGPEHGCRTVDRFGKQWRCDQGIVSYCRAGKLRVYINVPQIYSQVAKPGLKADLTLAEFPGRRFEGKLVRTADAIDLTIRTLLVEIEVNNPTGELLTGAFAEVHLKLPGDVSTFTIPVNTLLFRSEGLRVAAVKDGKANFDFR